jgi:hypothetical protein
VTEAVAVAQFASLLLEEAKRFLERGQKADDKTAESANFHAALMLAFCALEAHVNAVSDEVANWSSLTEHQRGVLLEKEVRLNEGKFEIGTKLQMARIQDRILVLHQIGKGTIKENTWREKLSGANDLRNKLTHPKTVPSITSAAVTKALEAVIETLDELYLAVYGRRFPAAHRKLVSKLEF